MPRVDQSADPGPPSFGSGSPVTAPVWLLALGVVVPLLALPLALLSGLAAHVAGWAIAIGGSLGALAAFTVVDLRRRSSRWYVDRPGLLGALRVAVLLLGFVVAGAFAYLIADAVARLDWWF
ncbi:hypothetical protein JL107_08580 [Nakamurella flavida]|uniref:Uncharacterized protein n=1 Tax=Nakamurella flavida TaxID=363630 RepID=A0A938YNJ7_9ACTN|nr:hypothetical protein [Nakamurella flavida]MBM9476494.1 hypothetical protein [Nakamurella flavida]MDP9779070.1 hypothetical protein [Nakamurella flavida]